jgi:hypothetical protein
MVPRSSLVRSWTSGTDRLWKERRVLLHLDHRQYLRVLAGAHHVAGIGKDAPRRTGSTRHLPEHWAPFTGGHRSRLPRRIQRCLMPRQSRMCAGRHGSTQNVLNVNDSVTREAERSYLDLFEGLAGHRTAWKRWRSIASLSSGVTWKVCCSALRRSIRTRSASTCPDSRWALKGCPESEASPAGQLPSPIRS